MHNAVAAVESAGRVHPPQGRKNSSVIKRSVIRNGHKSSISLEDQFWDALREIADDEKMAISTLVAHIDHNRTTSNLSSAIRVFVLDHFRHKDHFGDQNRNRTEAPASTVIKTPNRSR
jgi:predicted DNA-binding ribbon-helix-helix protein